MTWPWYGHADIAGLFHYDTLANIKNGTYVSYTNDRLVFYNDDTSSYETSSITFTGYVRCISFMIISYNLISPDMLFSSFVSCSIPSFDHDVDVVSTYIKLHSEWEIR